MSHCPQCSTPLRADGNCSACLLRLASTYRFQDGAADQAEIPASLRDHFPQLEILRVVGRGGMGVIYQARQTSLDRDVAIKVIDRTISSDKTFLDRFDREAKALARLSHPNIVAVYDYGRTSDGLAYLLMEYVHGLNLREALQSMSIDAAYALEIMEAVAQSLEYAHSKGVVHRDIKPENILLSDDGRIKLADFGIAKINDAALPERKITATNQVLGTAHYLAPEQLSDRNEVDHRVDIYALGVILYELLTGHLPVGNFEPASRVNVHVSTAVDTVLLRALQQRPTARYQSVEEFRLALKNCNSGQAAISNPPPATLVAGSLTSTSVPFYCTGFKGWSVVHGTLRSQDDGIHVEYQSRDNFIGQIRSKLRAATIPWDRVVRVDFRPGFLHGVFQINGDSFSLLENLPGSEHGCLMLNIKRENLELAEQVIQRVAAHRSHLVRTTLSLAQWQGPLLVAIPVGLILFGLLNAGVLAIAETAAASTDLYEHQKAMAIVFFGICMGPLFLAQLVLGIMYAATRSRAIGQAGALVSMIPLSPVALASIPFGIWARKQLQPAPSIASLNPTRSRGWGLTTVLLTAESKYARVASIVESVICAVLMGGIVLWMLGLYPTTLQYRIVGPASDEAISQFLGARLQGVPTLSIRQLGERRLQISALRRNRDRVVEQLAMTEAPTLLICADASHQKAESKPENYVPIASDKLPDGLLVRSSASGAEVAILSEVALSDDWLSSVQSNNDESLTLTWSRDGFAKIRELLSDQSAKPMMALKIDGWIEAITPDRSTDAQPAKYATFRWLSGSKRSIRSLQAALRGPSLATEFELID